ncbi:hypothetical protein GCM10008027_04200 [Pseudoalteromonas gelatinilytica]|uniref:Uncharacterized protein n=1 Tax=Pseudoalteromonas gelatinilytica TaxID=1703256 RepID=A0ABQ1T4Y8_9GAMM|nr:hypothetical protein GCM10008027_04200 [Pseudoalteromonas profundi]
MRRKIVKLENSGQLSDLKQVSELQGERVKEFVGWVERSETQHTQSFQI